MRNLSCIFYLNRIWYIGYIDEPLLILIWGEVFFHIILVRRCVLSEILTAGFGAGELCFKSTWYDIFICHQSHTTSTMFIYTIWTLSVVFQPTSSYSIHHNVLYQAYQFLFNSIIQEYDHNYFSRKKNPNNISISFLQ